MLRDLRTQQRLDRAALVHGPIPFRHLVERQDQIENLTRVDRAIPHQLDELGEVPPDGCRTAVKMDMGEEEFLAVELASRWRRERVLCPIRRATFQSLTLIADRRRAGLISFRGFLGQRPFLLPPGLFFLFCPLHPVSLGALKAVIGFAHSIQLLLGGCGRGPSKNCPGLRLRLHPALVQGDPGFGRGLGVETADHRRVGVRYRHLDAKTACIKRQYLIERFGVGMGSHDRSS